jgi:uncharacterized protein (DUF2235 family)
MKRIVICLDGTWNQVLDPDTVTNVVKLAQAVRPISSDNIQQIVYYNSGVGTGDLIDKFLGGVFGRGLRNNVKRAYAFLSLNYIPGDEIYIFGFSRGAYTARALAGVIDASGILRKQDYEKFEIAWNFYRIPPKIRNVLKGHDCKNLIQNVGASLAEKARSVRRRLRIRVPRAVVEYVDFVAQDKLYVEAKIRCVGVWDTVGSYGIPAGIGLGALSRIFTAWLLRGFHSTEIGKHIEIGLHAVAIDEKRRPFAPTFWTIAKGRQPAGHVEQVWFVGAHANVGGSYRDPRLSDVALIWMMARAVEIGREKFQSALDFDLEFVRQRTHPSPLGTLYRSERWWPISRIWPYLRPVFPPDAIQVRAILWNGENKHDEHINEMVHWSVMRRLGESAPVHGAGNIVYRPPNVEQATITPDRITQCTLEEQRMSGAMV